MSEVTGVSERTLKRRLTEMPNVEYVGRGYSGYWSIKKEKQEENDNRRDCFNHGSR